MGLLCCRQLTVLSTSMICCNAAMYCAHVPCVTGTAGQPCAPPVAELQVCGQVVFGVCAMGAVVLTLNVVLLGGNIGFFQSLCLLGYCLLPLDVAAIVATFVTNHIVRSVVVAVALAWASWASVPFIGGSVSPARKVLAVYPLLLLFFSMGWLALVKN